MNSAEIWLFCPVIPCNWEKQCPGAVCEQRVTWSFLHISACISQFGSSCSLSCWIICKPCILSLAWFTKGNCDFIWWLIRDKSTQQELSVPVWCSIKVTAVISVFGQRKPRLHNLVHHLLFIAFHRSSRGAQTHVWINTLLCKVFSWCWANVIFLGMMKPKERPLYSKGLWLCFSS